jgi:hypothetical protein
MEKGQQFKGSNYHAPLEYSIIPFLIEVVEAVIWLTDSVFRSIKILAPPDLSAERTGVRFGGELRVAIRTRIRLYMLKDHESIPKA